MWKRCGDVKGDARSPDRQFEPESAAPFVHLLFSCPAGLDSPSLLS